jgi:hypothetical protein
MKKTKRIKQVFSNASEVLHLWANQAQEQARTAGTGGGIHSSSGDFAARVFFKGRSCYSYGHHYELGRLVEYKGRTVAIINASGYSPTTGKHVNYAWNAVEHIPRIKSKQGIVDVKAGILEMQAALIDQVMGIFNQRKFYSEYNPLKVERDGHRPWMLKDVEAFNATCRALGFDKHVIEIDAAFVALIDEHVAIQQAKQAAGSTPEALAIKQAKALKKNAEAVAKWRLGASATNAVQNLSPQILRVHNNEVQTSRGARVSLPDALALLRAIENGTAKAGTAIGPYTFTSVENGIVRIGCHTISLADAKAVLQSASPMRLVHSA